MLGIEAWENELFDRYNGEGHQTEEEKWADIYDEDFARMEAQVNEHIIEYKGYKIEWSARLKKHLVTFWDDQIIVEFFTIQDAKEYIDEYINEKEEM